MQEISLKMIYFERGLSKNLKKSYFYFLFQTHSFLMDKILTNKIGQEPVTLQVAK